MGRSPEPPDDDEPVDGEGQDDDDPEELDGQLGLLEVLEDPGPVRLVPVLEEAAERDLRIGPQGDMEERQEERGEEGQGQTGPE